MNELNMLITPAADRFIRRMLRFDGGPMSGFSLSVALGGASGLSSKFAVNEQPDAGETVLEMNGLRFFVGAESRALLQGVVMDFQETPTTDGFKFHDLNKKSTRGVPGDNEPDLPEHNHEH